MTQLNLNGYSIDLTISAKANLEQVEWSSPKPEEFEVETTNEVTTIRQKSQGNNLKWLSILGSSHPQVKLHVNVPENSSIKIELNAGGCTLEGQFDCVETNNNAGNLSVEKLRQADFHLDAGNVNIQQVETAKIALSAGNIKIGQLTSDAKLKVDAGSIKIAQTEGGTLEARTNAGNIKVGVQAGVSVKADCHTNLGKVETDLKDSNGPASNQILHLQAQTNLGNIKITRA
ncbi:hypothetical protein BK816_00225 [Boudabousia tangfeifanii]|uniref:DUF4097 domain-containing protein n=1 Tax=Boudabousia tangfeifanii TaxID=1912795 RepID=A0A1D9MI82_9ACTO|nr:DUF4097 family beta strand repeat-containing protein [Boudabousia tangfeifanii]AOZ71908.1 hypothetical protein BK816_00225 [Boudabousia tangfeifanii]